MNSTDRLKIWNKQHSWNDTKLLTLNDRSGNSEKRDFNVKLSSYSDNSRLLSSSQLTEMEDGSCTHLGLSPSRSTMASRETSGVCFRTPQSTPEVEETHVAGDTSATLATALLAQQLPPLSTFSGEAAENADDTYVVQHVEDWLEQFEIAATMCK